MCLRFQDGLDDVDKAVRGERSIALNLFLFSLLAISVGVVSWLSGKTLHSYFDEMGFLAIFGVAWWLVFPIYSELKLRSKETYGIVTEISQAISALQKKLDAIEDELRSRTDER